MKIYLMVRMFVPLLFLLIALPVNVLAFDGGEFRLNGVVTESVSGNPIPGVAVVCKSTGEGVISNENGLFVIDISWSDSLIFQAINYENAVVKPPDSLFENGEIYSVQLDVKQHLIDEVEVKGKAGVPLQQRSDVFKDKPRTADYLISPISALYYHGSKKEKRKREMQRMIAHDKMMVQFSEIYNRETIAKYSGLSGHDVDYCMIYCNAHINLRDGDSEEVVRLKMMSAISAYFRQKAGDDSF